MNKNKIMKAMPTVLFISGIAGIFVSEIMVARDTLKAEKVLYDANIKLPDDTPVLYADNRVYATVVSDKPTYYKEVVKATWKCYIPTLVSTALTCAALIASNRLTAKQVALLSSAVASGGALVQKYRKQIVERFGEEPLKEIDKAVAQATLKESNPPCINTGTGGIVSYSEFDSKDGDDECLFFDPFTKIKFRSTKLAVFGAKYYLNRNFALGGNVPLEMFYNFLGIELPEEYKYCEWDCDILAEDGYIWIDIDFTKSDEVDPETGEQYYIIEYGFDPGECEDSYYPLGNPMETEGSHVNT